MEQAFSKKTKAEILEEYQKLKDSYEELKAVSQLVHDPQTVELMTKVKSYTPDNLTQSIENLKTSFNTALSQLSDSLLTEAQKLGEMQRALEISKNNLQVHYNVGVAAGTLEILVKEYDRKRQELEETRKQEAQRLDEEIAAKKRDWTREQEEYEYTATLERKRADAAYEEVRARKEQELIKREEALKQQEQELQNLRKQAEGMSQQLERAAVVKEQEVTKRLKMEFDSQLTAARKEWEGAKKIDELRIQNLEETIKKLNSELASYKVEAERAGKKAQELAIKVIESSSLPFSRSEEEKPPVRVM